MKSNFFGNILRRPTALVAALAMTACIAAHADSFTNGSFESNGGAGQIGFNTSVAGWSVPSGSYNFVFDATSAVSGASGQFGANDVALAQGATIASTDPDGGAFIGLDGDYPTNGVGSISQQITGLVSGQSYNVSFDWAASQQLLTSACPQCSGPTVDQLQVSFGSQSQNTASINLASQDFSGWMHETFSFTADGTSDTLSFLAIGTPGGEPPFTLLDGVSVAPPVRNVVPTPEPASLVLLATGLCGVGGIMRRRFVKA